MDRLALTRRDCLKLAAGATLGGQFAPALDVAARAAAPVAPKSVAAVVTIYGPKSHSDVILGKILEGWKQDGGPGPALKLASLYVDQFPRSDLSRAMCEKHNVPMFDSIAKAVTVGGDSIPVDGVLCIAEHGDYPFSPIGQHLYPRRRFLAEVSDAFEKHGRVVPVFNDKHLGPAWEDALWMYQRARELKFPFMAGSSMPVGARRSEFTLPMGSEIEAAVGLGYSGLDVYGFHALEFYQYYVERRRDAERGVKSVRCLEGAEVWKAVDSGQVSQAALEAAFEAVPKPDEAVLRNDPHAALFLFEYVDGFTGALFMLSCIQGTSVGLKLKNQERPVAVAFNELSVPKHPHFAYLLKGIERMIHSGRPTYPVERTLLTSGILDRALTSRAMGGKPLSTPELAIEYQPVDYPHAPHVDLLAAP